RAPVRGCGWWWNRPTRSGSRPAAASPCCAMRKAPPMPERPWATEVDALARALDLDPRVGLATDEAARRLRRDGPNQLQSAPETPAWQRMLAQFKDPLIYLLLAAVVISLLAWVVEGRHGWPVAAVVVALIVLLNGILGYVAAARAARAVAAFSRMTEDTSPVLRDGQLVRIPSVELGRGDVLVLGEGDA